MLDDQLALIESRLDAMATRSYRSQAGGLLNHARFVADSLRPDPFQAWLAEPAINDAEPIQVAAPEQDARRRGVDGDERGRRPDARAGVT